MLLEEFIALYSKLTDEMKEALGFSLRLLAAASPKQNDKA